MPLYPVWKRVEEFGPRQNADVTDLVRVGRRGHGDKRDVRLGLSERSEPREIGARHATPVLDAGRRNRFCIMPPNCTANWRRQSKRSGRLGKFRACWLPMHLEAFLDGWLRVEFDCLIVAVCRGRQQSERSLLQPLMHVNVFHLTSKWE